jgi:hypothetical protein
MTTALPLLAALLVAAAPAATRDGRAPTDLAPRPFASADGHGGDTRCAACHTAEGWRPVSFAHERTGFPLEGRHKDAPCKACHASGTFADPVPKACAACHRDVHLGRLGQRCGRCHEPTTWAMATFGPDAHRQTNFPLSGRHAILACEECHGDRRDRGFSRPTGGCIACHEADWARASGGLAAVDHDAVGFPQDCRGCHGAWRFSPAGLPQHQACFDIRSGHHAGIKCRDCHNPTFPTGIDYSQPFTCAPPGTANCIRCHGTDHEPVDGFQAVNRACYECHRFSVGD